MMKVKLEQLLATESDHLQKLNEIVHTAIEEEKLLSNKLLEFEDGLGKVFATDYSTLFTFINQMGIRL